MKEDKTMAMLVIYMSEEEIVDFEGMPVVGKEYKVLEVENIMNGSVSYRLSSDTSEGWGGNVNSKITRYHGWRGTTNDRSAEALGIRKVLKVTEYKNGSCRILMSEDLHPEME